MCRSTWKSDFPVTLALPQPVSDTCAPNISLKNLESRMTADHLHDFIHDLWQRDGHDLLPQRQSAQVDHLHEFSMICGIAKATVCSTDSNDFSMNFGTGKTTICSCVRFIRRDEVHLRPPPSSSVGKSATRPTPDFQF